VRLGIFFGWDWALGLRIRPTEQFVSGQQLRGEVGLGLSFVVDPEISTELFQALYREPSEHLCNRCALKGHEVINDVALCAAIRQCDFEAIREKEQVALLPGFQDYPRPLRHRPSITVVHA
jgi:hypothetical protein